MLFNLYPEQRFCARHSRQEPYALVARVRICTGAPAGRHSYRDQMIPLLTILVHRRRVIICVEKLITLLTVFWYDAVFYVPEKKMKKIANSLSSVFQMKGKSQSVKSLYVNSHNARDYGPLIARALLACHMLVVTVLVSVFVLPGNALAGVKGDSVPDDIDPGVISIGADQSPTVANEKSLSHLTLASSSTGSLQQPPSEAIIGQWLLEIKKENLHVYVMVRFNADGSVDKVDTSDFGHARNPGSGEDHLIGQDTPSMGYWYHVNTGQRDELRAVMYYFEHDTDSGEAEEIRATVLSNLEVDGNTIKGNIHIAAVKLTGSPAEVMNRFNRSIHKHDYKIETSKNNSDFRVPLNGVRMTSRY